MSREACLERTMSRKTANLLCLLVAMIWGGGFIATSAALETFEPFTVLMIRFVGAAVISWIVLLACRIRITKKGLLKGSVCGIFMYLAFAFQTFGLDLTETGSNAFLTAVNVVLVPYIVWLCFRKKPSALQIGASFLCLAGIGALSLSSGSLQLRPGDLLSLICALFFAAQIVALDWSSDCDPMLINTIQMSVSAVLSIPLALTMDSWPAHISVSAVFSCLYMVAVSTWLAFWLQTTAQKYTDASSASLLLCTESLWANIFGWLLLHEEKTPLMLFGGALILVSVVLVEGQSLFTRKQPEIQKSAD